MEQKLMELSDIDKFILARWCYSVGSPVMEDFEYNTLQKYIEDKYPDSEYVKRTWSDDPCPVDLLEKVGKKELIKSVVLLDKTESIPSLNSEAELVEALGSISEEGTLSMKHDGWNVQANYYNKELVNVQTRGRSTNYMDVSVLESKIPHYIKYPGSVKVVMELTVSKDNFKECAKLFNNVSPRNAVPSVLSRPEYHYLLSLTGVDIHGVDLTDTCKFVVLRDLGFNVPMYYVVSNYEQLKEAMQLLSNEEPYYPEPTDGMVFDGELKKAIRLLAWEEPIYMSYVIGYKEQFGPNRISPSVLIRPILRKGTTQKRLNITNWQRIIDYNLMKGAPIAFRVASSAVADFDEGTTLLLHKQWEGKWSEYKDKIDQEEEVRRCQQLVSLNTI